MRSTRTVATTAATVLILALAGCTTTSPAVDTAASQEPTPAASTVVTPSLIPSLGVGPTPTPTPTVPVEHLVKIVEAPMAQIRAAWKPMQDDGCALGIASGCAAIPRTVDRQAKAIASGLTAATDPSGGAVAPDYLSDLVTDTVATARKVDNDVDDHTGKAKHALYNDMVMFLVDADQWLGAQADPADFVPNPKWTPCADDPGDVVGSDCEDSFDPCDLAYYGVEDTDHGLEALIENAAFYDAKRLKDCPQFQPIWARARTGFTDGAQIVGRDVKPGRYVTTSAVSGGTLSDCYWERDRGGHIVANNIVGAASKVYLTVRSTDDAVTTDNCGDWVRVG